MFAIAHFLQPDHDGAQAAWLLETPVSTALHEGMGSFDDSRRRSGDRSFLRGAQSIVSAIAGI